ncbi:RTX toxin, partial [Candidatus Magnetomorum sp. HK-1]
MKNHLLIILILMGVFACGKDSNHSEQLSPPDNNQSEQIIYEEHFDAADIKIDIPENSSWGIVETDETGKTFSGVRYLSSNPYQSYQQHEAGSDNIVRASMKSSILVEESIEEPVISFWYKMNLNPGDKILIDLNYSDNSEAQSVKRNKKDSVFHTIKNIKVYTVSHNKADYCWDFISLKSYKKMNVWLSFRQWIEEDGPASEFALDDLRISNFPDDDKDQNDVPDVFEKKPDTEKLPFIDIFQARRNQNQKIELSWQPGDVLSRKSMNGFHIYRKRHQSVTGYIKIHQSIIPFNQWSFIDDIADNSQDYDYYIVPVSLLGIEGYLSKIITIFQRYNNKPKLKDRVQTTVEDVCITLTVQHFQSLFHDADDDTLEYIKIINLPSHGTLMAGETVLTAESLFHWSQFSNVSYIPNTHYFGCDHFSWNGSDSNDYAEQNGIFRIIIRPINDPPIIQGQQALSVLEETPLTLQLSDFTLKDPDILLNVGQQSLSVCQGLHYTFHQNTIYPEKDFFSLLNVCVTASDGSDEGPEFLAEVRVINVNDPPEIMGQKNIHVDEDTGVILSLSHLIIQDKDLTTDWTLILKPGNHYSFTQTTIIPSLHYNGVLNVPVIVSDGIDLSNPFTVQIHVDPVNDPPVITGQKVLNLPEDIPFDLTLSQLSISDPDHSVNDWSLIIHESNQYTVQKQTIIPARNYYGSLIIPVQVTDHEALSNRFD